MHNVLFSLRSKERDLEVSNDFLLYGTETGVTSDGPAQTALKGREGRSVTLTSPELVDAGADAKSPDKACGSLSFSTVIASSVGRRIKKAHCFSRK